MLAHCPSPPAWQVDWARLRAAYTWVEALHECPQDALYHAEGDVGTHTHMALEALAGSEAFRALPLDEREAVFLAVLLHDVAKPACTRHEDGRITSRGHSARGEIDARRLLWGEGLAFARREAVCGLVRHHQVPFFLIEREDCRRLAYRVSQVARCDHLALVAQADAEGRRCAEAADQRRMLDNVSLFRELCAEHDCLSAPRRFASDHSRFVYFHRDDRDPDYHAFDDSVCEVTLMSGLPGAGKDTWIREHAAGLPAISLDETRRRLGVHPAAGQRKVVEDARGQARVLLRERRDFVWNATNVSGSIRETLIGLFAGYRARVRIVYVESPEQVVRTRNREREHPVPDEVLDRLLRRWSVPSLIEAHEVVHCVG